MLCLSCFATAWLAYSLAKRMQQSEALASSRGIDLKNLAQVNALITQEMQDGVVVVNEDLDIRHHNVQAESLLGFTSSNKGPISLNTAAPEIATAFHHWAHIIGASSETIVTISNRELKLRLMPISQQRDLGAVIFIQDWSLLQAKTQQTKLAALGQMCIRDRRSNNWHGLLTNQPPTAQALHLVHQWVHPLHHLFFFAFLSSYTPSLLSCRYLTLSLIGRYFLILVFLIQLQVHEQRVNSAF